MTIFWEEKTFANLQSSIPDLIYEIDIRKNRYTRPTSFKVQTSSCSWHREGVIRERKGVCWAVGVEVRSDE